MHRHAAIHHPPAATTMPISCQAPHQHYTCLQVNLNPDAAPLDSGASCLGSSLNEVAVEIRGWTCWGCC